METYLATKPEQLRAAQMDLDEMGGFWLAPIQMINDILKIADDMVYVRQMAEVTPRVDAQALGATFMETDLEDADWNSEIGEISETTAKWGTRVLRPKDMNKYVGMSYRSMMQVPSLSAWLVERLGYKRGITEERAYFVGNGVNEALGAFVASDQGIRESTATSATATRTTDISLVGLQSALWSIHSAATGTTWPGSEPASSGARPAFCAAPTASLSGTCRSTCAIPTACSASRPTSRKCARPSSPPASTSASSATGRRAITSPTPTTRPSSASTSSSQPAT